MDGLADLVALTDVLGVAETETEGEADLVAETETDGEALTEVEGVALTETDGLADLVAETETDDDSEPERLTDTEGEAETTAPPI